MPGKGVCVDQTAGKPRRIGFVQEIRKNSLAYLMTVPALLFFIAFNYVPMAGAWLAFVDYNLVDGIFGSPFIGLKNFDFFISGGEAMYSAVWNTIVLNLLFLLFGTSVQIVLALLMNELRSKPFKKVSQSLMFIPYFFSWVVVGAIVQGFLSSHGLVNTMLEFVGLDPVRWYSSPQYWKAILVVVNIWKFAGYGIVVYMATIASLDSSIYEAAEIDGAGKLAQIWRITLPLLRPTIVILTLLTIGRIFYGDFGMIVGVVRGNGLIGPEVEVIDSYVYHAMLTGGNLGWSAAVGLVQSGLGLIVILAVNAFAKKINEGEGLF